MPDPGRPTSRQEAPPPGALVPPPQRAKPARKSAACGVGDNSPRPQPPHPQPVGGGPRPHAPEEGRSAVVERPTPEAPRPGKRRPPWAPSCRPHSAQSQLARARAVGLVTGTRAHNLRTHSQWVVGRGRMPQNTSGRAWESSHPRTPHTQARGAPPQAPMCRPHSTQSQLARARAVGRVTRHHANSPHIHSQWVVGPSRTPQRTSCRGWESAQFRRPHNQARGAPPGRPLAAPTARKASSQERVTTPAPPTPTASGWWAPAARPKGWTVEVGRAPNPGRPTLRQEAPPPGALVPPPQRAKPARRSARYGVRDGSPGPHSPHPWPVDSGPRPHAPKNGRSGVGERLTPDAPHTGKRRPPRAPSCRPQKRAKPAHKSRPARRGAREPKQGKGTKGPGHPPAS